MVILLIDDDSDDTDLFREAVFHLESKESFDREKNPIECIVVNDGCEAVGLLPELSKLPDLIFLDINMPIMGGKDCLQYLKKSEKFRGIPVVMFSTTFRNVEVEEFKAMGAIECLKKPNGFNDLVKILSEYVYGAFS